MSENIRHILEYFKLEDILKLEPNLANFLKLIGTVTIGSSILYIGKIWFSYSYFKRKGIKTPSYSFLYGNFPEIANNGLATTLHKWTQELGEETYGYYEGHTPILVTSDVDLLQEVFIKKYSHFTARKLMPFQFADNSGINDLVVSSGDHWKRMRNIINPTFSAAKLKDLLPLMALCSDRLLDAIDKNLNQEINVSDYFNRLTMDTIWNCAFGMDIDAQNNPNDKFLILGEKFFGVSSRVEPIIKANIYFPEFKLPLFVLAGVSSLILKRINENLMTPFIALADRVSLILDERLKKKKDYFQLLIEAQSSANSSEGEPKINKYLTTRELKSNLIVFLLAGYETTSTTLSYCLYVLATHPSELVKLREEIDSCLQDDENAGINYDTINKLEYLDYFVKEVLRFYPIGTLVVNRRCLTPLKIKDIQIDKGLVVHADLLSLHFSKKHWPGTDPNVFDPMRFAPPNKINQLAYVPFGLGPRNCIGMRFALLEIKISLIKILSKYDVLATENTPTKLEFSEGISVRRPKDGVKIMFKKRA